VVEIIPVSISPRRYGESEAASEDDVVWRICVICICLLYFGQPNKKASRSTNFSHTVFLKQVLCLN
jgi:hypothetical protein